jgi:hypothetical protein
MMGEGGGKKRGYCGLAGSPVNLVAGRGNAIAEESRSKFRRAPAVGGGVEDGRCVYGFMRRLNLDNFLRALTASAPIKIGCCLVPSCRLIFFKSTDRPTINALRHTIFYSVVLYPDTFIFASSESHFERGLDFDSSNGVLVFLTSSIWTSTHIGICVG